MMLRSFPMDWQTCPLVIGSCESEKELGRKEEGREGSLVKPILISFHSLLDRRKSARMRYFQADLVLLIEGSEFALQKLCLSLVRPMSC